MAYPVQPNFVQQTNVNSNTNATGPKALIEAAGNGNYAFCEAFLEEHPDYVNGKGVEDLPFIQHSLSYGLLLL